MRFDLKSILRLGCAVAAGLSVWTAPAVNWTDLFVPIEIKLAPATRPSAAECDTATPDSSMN